MKIGILGCGLIGKKRGQQLFGHQLAGVYDPNSELKIALSKELSCPSFNNEADLIEASELVIIATPNERLGPLAIQAARAGRHVLVEKPGAITVEQMEELEQLSKSKNVAVKVGFNHRFHPALLETRRLIDNGDLGELMYMRARYGHGGRLGYEKEWRSNAELSGGGELIDQGVHILDLIYWFFGPLPLKNSYVTTSFWDMKVDDNAVLTVASENSATKQWATFHVSCSEWKNTFSLELYGRKAKILINGLGRSYGTETLTLYRMLPEMGPPVTEVKEFGGEDRSWELDLKNLIDHVETKSPLWGDVSSAKYALTQVMKAYKENGYNDFPGTR